ncbi:MAG: SDR family NAD(P)-dependent oxidoreductase [Planctomycetota bacterium]
MSARGAVLVTGGSRGIGLAIATRLAQEGYPTALVARNRERLEQVKADLGRTGVPLWTRAVDLLDPASPAGILEDVRAHLGPISLLVNNAGTAPSDAIARTTDAMLREALALHVAVPMALIRGAFDDLLACGSGTILNVASSAGLRGFPFASAYTAAKHGMVGLSRALAAELAGTTIRVYALCPGFVDTDITRAAAEAIAARGRSTVEEALLRLGRQNRIGRMHTREEVAEAALGLIRDRPAGCVYDLDRREPGFVDAEP